MSSSRDERSAIMYPVGDDDGIFTGDTRPRQIPTDWLGEPLPDGAGWQWCDPSNRGNCVRFFRGDPESLDASRREPFVVVAVDGELLDRNGDPTGEVLRD